MVGILWIFTHSERICFLSNFDYSLARCILRWKYSQNLENCSMLYFYKNGCSTICRYPYIIMNLPHVFFWEYCRIFFYILEAHIFTGVDVFLFPIILFGPCAQCGPEAFKLLKVLQCFLLSQTLYLPLLKAWRMNRVRLQAPGSRPLSDSSLLLSEICGPSWIWSSRFYQCDFWQHHFCLLALSFGFCF